MDNHVVDYPSKKFGREPLRFTCDGKTHEVVVIMREKLTDAAGEPGKNISWDVIDRDGETYTLEYSPASDSWKIEKTNGL